MTQTNLTPKPFAVFLSFNSKDRDAVRCIAEYLAAIELRPWFDEWELIPGESWVDGLYRGLQESAACAVFVGQSGEGPWQQQEVRTALIHRAKDQDFRIIPVLLPVAQQEPELPPFLSMMMWVDFRRKTLQDDETLWRLECGIRGQSPGQGRPNTSSRPIPSPSAPPQRQANVQQSESLDTRILRALYAYYQAHPGDPDMSVDELLQQLPGASTTTVQTELFALKQKGWITSELTDAGTAGLVRIEPKGIKIAKQL